MAREPLRRESYTHDEQFTREVMGRRSARSSANLLVPHLSPVMRVLDCGCGQGSITVDLAEIVAPGETVGIDIRETDLAAARTHAAERGITNVAFRSSSVYELPFRDDSFDAALAHQVMHHLGDPLAALREIRRVLKPGGVLAVGDHIWDRVIRAPMVPAIERWDSLRPGVISQNGGTPEFARNQGVALREAGFARVETLVNLGEGEAAPRNGPPGLVAGLPYFRTVGRGVIRAQRWATEEELDAMEAALAAWSKDPNSLWALPVAWALAWK